MAPTQPFAAEEPWRRLCPFRSRRLVLADGSVHYFDAAPGGTSSDSKIPTLLFVHGNPTWSFHWRRLIAGLADRARCVAVDHLGCGLSDLAPRPLRLADRIAHLVEFVDRLDLTQMTLVAQDWGGAIGLGAVLARRERFQRIALFNTGAFRPWFIPWRIRVCRTPLLGPIALQGGNLFSRAAVRMTVCRRPLEADVVRGYLAPYDCWSRRAAVMQFVRDIPASLEHPTWATLGAIEDALPQLSVLPTLLTWGMRDWCFTPECLDRFVQVWPHAQVLRLADAGHWVVEDAAEEVLERLRAFVAERSVPILEGPAPLSPAASSP